MYKKIVGIFICTIFLFSALPTVTGTNYKNKIPEPLLPIKNDNNPIKPFDFDLILMYGRIKYNGEADIDNLSCYNVTPIFLRIREIMWHPNQGFFYMYIIVTDNPFYIPKDYFKGFVGENYMFLFEIWT